VQRRLAEGLSVALNYRPRFGLCAMLLLLAVPNQDAHAQFSTYLRLSSDFRYRGQSLSNRHASVQGTLAYDHLDGWFGGLNLSSVEFRRPDGPNGRSVVYLGYAQRLTNELSWEAAFGQIGRASCRGRGEAAGVEVA